MLCLYAVRRAKPYRQSRAFHRFKYAGNMTRRKRAAARVNANAEHSGAPEPALEEVPRDLSAARRS